LKILSRVIFASSASADPWHSDLILASVISSSARIEVLRAATRPALKNDQSRLDKFGAFMDDAVKTNKARNRYAHGVYIVSTDDQLCIIDRRFEIGHTRHVTVVRPTDLRDELGRSGQLIAQLTTFHDPTASSSRRVGDFIELKKEPVFRANPRTVDRTHVPVVTRIR
jgi:hypothetical protein